jgi:hypothetical protein
MASKNKNLSYGLGSPLINVFPSPIVAQRAPKASDKYEYGQVWINQPVNDVYVYTSNGNWIGTGGGTGAFDTVSAVTTITAGTTVTSGTSMVVGTTLDVGGAVTIAADGLDVTGQIETDVDVVARGVFIDGDEGTGLIGSLALTNVSDAVLGAGAMTIHTKTANNGSNTGYLKLYLGTTVVYVPYFDDISP